MAETQTIDKRSSEKLRGRDRRSYNLSTKLTTNEAKAVEKAASAEDFAKLGQGDHPQTDEQMVRERASYEYQDADGKTIEQ